MGLTGNLDGHSPSSFVAEVVAVADEVLLDPERRHDQAFAADELAATGGCVRIDLRAPAPEKQRNGLCSAIGSVAFLALSSPSAASMPP